ncbi:MAG TPA: IS30 family transposase, partial [Kurthia sp.]
DMNSCTKDYIETCMEKLNKRPRKCLGWKTPYELFFGKALRLI